MRGRTFVPVSPPVSRVIEERAWGEEKAGDMPQMIQLRETSEEGFRWKVGKTQRQGLPMISGEV